MKVVSEDLIREIENKLDLIAKTGRVIYGANYVKWAVKNRRVKLVILASNTPSKIEEEIRKLCESKGVSIFKSRLNNIELGSKCLRPHIVTSLAILDFGVLSEKLEGSKIA